jgi:hypothetical protein
MTVSAKVILDSVSPDGIRLTTMELRYPRFIHSEFMTHRVFSRNASSSRAVPVETLIAEAETAPAMPEKWGIHNRGMQDGGAMSIFGERTAKSDWLAARDDAVARAKIMITRSERASKQIINRILEPFTHISVVVTSTYWKNFFTLRDHSAADPTMFALANAVIDARSSSSPLVREHSDWHLPYTTDEDIESALKYALSVAESMNIRDVDDLDRYIIDIMCRISTARCARVSYLTHDKKRPTVEEDLGLFSDLMQEKPLHASPAEHQAQPDRIRQTGSHSRGWENPHLHGNFLGWNQYRKQFVGEAAMEYGAALEPKVKVVA